MYVKTRFSKNCVCVRWLTRRKQQARLNAEQMKNFTTTNLFGTHMFMRMQMEKTILSQFRRLPGLPSEFVGLETILGEDETIDFDDYLQGKVVIVLTNLTLS